LEWGMAQVLGYLSSNHEALSSNSRTIRKKRERESQLGLGYGSSAIVLT
jgi:hypothetical protein